MKRGWHIKIETDKTAVITSGYTLIEVMVALIIIGISITAVTGALSTSKGLSARSNIAVESVRILKNILNNPELMGQIIENKTFERVLEDEDGWICRAETYPLVIDSADLLWDSNDIRDSGDDLIKNRAGEKNRAGQWKKDRRVTSKRKKSALGEEIEIPGMVSVILCVSQTSQLIEKEYCVALWKRWTDSNESEIVTKPPKQESKTK